MKKSLFLLLTFATMLFTACTKETIKEVEQPQEETVRTSTDYSADGQVNILQEATVPGATPIQVVLIGDGFADTDISSGYYMKVMEKTMENLFSIEPYISLRDYFEVSVVTAVSKNNAFGEGYETALGCDPNHPEYPPHGKDDLCLKYASKVPNIVLTEVLIIAIANTNKYGGVAEHTLKMEEKYTNAGIAYCPITDSLASYEFEYIIAHEVGHAFAKLLDEYSYEENGTITQEDISDLAEGQESYEWYMNISLTSNLEEVPWAKFIKDDRYSWENLGAYEGASSYSKGVYRPTDTSIMNDGSFYYFNAPSREAIYKRTLKRAYGNNFVYDYETFVAFDLKYHDELKKEITTQNRSVQRNNDNFRMHTRPIFNSKFK